LAAFHIGIQNTLNELDTSNAPTMHSENYTKLFKSKFNQI